MVIRSDPRRNDVSQGTPMTERWPWIAMLVALGLEFALGVASLLLVPAGRPDGWLPLQGRAVYMVHAGLGGILGIGALVIFAAASHGGRIVRLGAQIGLVGLLLGACGGILAAFHPWRLTGMGLMLAGTFVAFFGYLIPLLEQIQREELE
jgi:MFS family permease